MLRTYQRDMFSELNQQGAATFAVAPGCGKAAVMDRIIEAALDSGHNVVISKPGEPLTVRGIGTAINVTNIATSRTVSEAGE